MEQTKPVLRRLVEWMRPVVGVRALRLLNLYPPYVGAHVRIGPVAADLTWIEVEMKLRAWNQNYFGTHFGGSLYSMCDPFFALILTEYLGAAYVVWDKVGSIRFLRPGRGTVRARFEIPRERLERIRQDVDERGKLEVELGTEIRDAAGERVARVTKVLSIERRGRVDPASAER